MVDLHADVMPRPIRARRYLWGLALALATACAVALGEINAQSGRLVDSLGRAWPFSVLVGPGFVERNAGWPEVLGGLIDDQLYRALLSWHLVIGLIFMITYGALLAGLVAVLFRNRGARIALWAVVAGTVALDLAENVCIDLSAQWLAQVRSHNDAVVAGRSTEPLIMPFAVFLTNEQATAGRLTQPPALQSELLLPAVGYFRGSATLTRTDALLQRVSTTVRTRAICPVPTSGTVDCDAIADHFPRRVIVVDRTAQPEVTAPLGWVLSTASMTGLDRAMQHQVTTRCTAGSTEPACLRGYGTLGDLLGYLHGP